MQCAAAGDHVEKLSHGKLGGLERKRAERNQYDQRQPKKRRAKRDPKARDHAFPPSDDRRRSAHAEFTH